MKRALLGLLLVGCVVARPAAPSLPDGFPADFPIPPDAKLLIGMPNVLDSGTLVAVTIVPGRPSPTP